MHAVIQFNALGSHGNAQLAELTDMRCRLSMSRPHVHGTCTLLGFGLGHAERDIRSRVLFYVLSLLSWYNYGFVLVGHKIAIRKGRLFQTIDLSSSPHSSGLAVDLAGRTAIRCSFYPS